MPDARFYCLGNAVAVYESMYMKYSLLIVVLCSLAACSGEPPYIHRPYTINRDIPTFPDGPEIKKGTSLTVCYAKSRATPAQIRALANEECAKGGLAAAFAYQAYDICPMVSPIAAVFSCESAVATRAPAPGATLQGGAGVAVPAFAAPRPAGAGRSLGTIGAADVSTTAKSEPFPTYLFNNAEPAR